MVPPLNLVVAQSGVPKRIQMDNDLEFISKEVDLWALPRGSSWISPGRGSPRIMRSWNRSTAFFSVVNLTFTRNYYLNNQEKY